LLGTLRSLFIITKQYPRKKHSCLHKTRVYQMWNNKTLYTPSRWHAPGKFWHPGCIVHTPRWPTVLPEQHTKIYEKRPQEDAQRKFGLRSSAETRKALILTQWSNKYVHILMKTIHLSTQHFDILHKQSIHLLSIWWPVHFQASVLLATHFSPPLFYPGLLNRHLGSNGSMH